MKFDIIYTSLTHQKVAKRVHDVHLLDITVHYMHLAKSNSNLDVFC